MITAAHDRVAAQLRVLPAEPGVYRFRDGRGRVLYVGRATGLRSRVRSYFSELADRPRLRSMIPRIARIEAVVCASVHEAAWLERLVLQHRQSVDRLPRWNATPGGQENPVWIRLDSRAASAGLRIEHGPVAALAGTECFGPFLGGEQARRALAGLHRVLPLSATSSARTAAERDLAALRPGLASERSELVDRLCRVLGCRADAVDQTLAELVARRNSAVASQAFELAGRINAEVAAVQWVTSVQRVCRPGGPDQQPAGWCDGVRISFMITAGELVDWTVAVEPSVPTVEAPSRAPAGWRSFVDRNAALAAALVHAG